MTPNILFKNHTPRVTHINTAHTDEGLLQKPLVRGLPHPRLAASGGGTETRAAGKLERRPPPAQSRLRRRPRRSPAPAGD